jgi:DNA-binding transcriptional ArsR family regulator
MLPAPMLVRSRPDLQQAAAGLEYPPSVWTNVTRFRAHDVHGDPFNALGDPHRRAIVQLLGTRERSVQELAAVLPISRPAVSRHLRMLRVAGLVEEKPEGTRRIYRLQAAGVEAVQAYLLQVWGDAAVRFRIVAENPPHDHHDELA